MISIDKRFKNVGTENGNITSQLKLGECYLYGEGTVSDYEQAVYWLSRAAQQNDIGAQKLLGECYENGWGVQQDPEKAKEYYEMSASDL